MTSTNETTEKFFTLEVLDVDVHRVHIHIADHLTGTEEKMWLMLGDQLTFNVTRKRLEELLAEATFND